MGVEYSPLSVSNLGEGNNKSYQEMDAPGRGRGRGRGRGGRAGRGRGRGQPQEEAEIFDAIPLAEEAHQEGGEAVPPPPPPPNWEHIMMMQTQILQTIAANWPTHLKLHHHHHPRSPRSENS